MPRSRRSTRALLSLALLAWLGSAWADATPTSDTPPTAAEAPIERPALPERSQLEAQALSEHLPAAQQQQLGPDNDRFLALWRAANTPTPKGAVVILPGAGQSADDPRLAGPLRASLPDTGWHSLSLTLPDPSDPLQALTPAKPAPAPEPPPATDPDAPPAEPSDAAEAPEASAPAAPTAPDTVLSLEAQQLAHAERIFARLDAALAFAQNQQASRVVLLGDGSGAYWAGRYLSERKPQNIQHLIVVEPTLPLGFAPPLEALLPALKLATGDFFYKDNAANRTQALLRKQSAQRLGHTTYTQIAMKALPGNQAVEREQLQRRIRGWLEKNAQK